MDAGLNGQGREIIIATPLKPRKKSAAPRGRAERLDPGLRKKLILDKAAALVIAKGISNCSLDAVAEAAGVSKALVYKYFPNRDALLGALLQREFEYMQGLDGDPTQAPRPQSGQSIDEVLRIGVYSYLQYLAERGGLFRMLINDAGVAGQMQKALIEGRGANMRFWTDRTMAAYGLPYDLARIGVIMTSYALDGAQGSVRSGKIEADRLADFWTTFVRAGWVAVGKKFGSVS